MQQYLELLKTIKDQGVHKPAAREGMPGTTSLFGYQFRHDLSLGFPLLTTKKMYWKGIVAELLWFLRGDTNIKYLIDNNVHIWDQDAYNYYLKKCKEWDLSPALPHRITYEHSQAPLTFHQFISNIIGLKPNQLYLGGGYSLGDCGYQYGKVWRGFTSCYEGTGNHGGSETYENEIDQIHNVIQSLKRNPEGRRHIVTSIDPGHDTDLALYWCHAMFQFNCRPVEFEVLWDRLEYKYDEKAGCEGSMVENIKSRKDLIEVAKEFNVPIYYLDCQLYQRSADVVLGVPFNIASYALLMHIIADLCNFIPGEFIHTFGDVHIYDNHIEAVEEQLSRTPTSLPKLRINTEFWNPENVLFNDITELDSNRLTNFIKSWTIDDFQIEDYNPQSPIKAELSTGLKK